MPQRPRAISVPLPLSRLSSPAFGWIVRPVLHPEPDLFYRSGRYGTCNTTLSRNAAIEHHPMDTSPQHAEPPRKRRRPALSCKQCRIRKVKCDRSSPFCDRCARAGQAHACAYSDDAERGDPARRRSHLSSSLERRPRTPPGGRPSQEMTDPVPTEAHTGSMYLKGKDCRLDSLARQTP